MEVENAEADLERWSHHQAAEGVAGTPEPVQLLQLNPLAVEGTARSTSGPGDAETGALARQNDRLGAAYRRHILLLECLELAGHMLVDLGQLRRRGVVAERKQRNDLM